MEFWAFQNSGNGKVNLWAFQNSGNLKMDIQALEKLQFKNGVWSFFRTVAIGKWTFELFKIVAI